MNVFQTTLYNELMALVVANEAFYFQDFPLDGKIYRIFNYRLASYTDFQAPSAMECRGHMFEVDSEGNALRLASIPMRKFFNLNENPSTIGLDLALVDTVELKADGSLISSYMHNGELWFKSKGSLASEQAVDAMAWIRRDIRGVFGFRKVIEDCERAEYTVNLEWCAPHNRIVIGYPTAHLKVLNVRSRVDGHYMDRSKLEKLFERDTLIDRVDTGGLDVAAFVQSIPSMLGDIEGYVARIGDMWFKVKTDKYISLHHAKDSVNNPRRLFEAILDEGIDDLRVMFFEDPLAIQIIDEMQKKVDHVFNQMVKMVETYYEENRALDRKSFAIKGQEHFKDTFYFGLAMNRYVGKPVDYKQFLKSKWKELGFKDTALEKTE
jgi:T4 RnlA family RNA ligase